MRVLFAANREYLPQAVGGAEWSTHYLCRGLIQCGEEVAVLCDLKNQGWLGFRNRLLRRITRHSCPQDMSMGYPVFRGWNATGGLSDVCGQFNPDVIVIVGAPPRPYQLALEALETDCSIFYQIRDTAFDRHGGDLSKLDGVNFISNSEFTRSRLMAIYGLDSDVILPPIIADMYRVKTTGNKVLVINPDPAKGGEIALSIAEQCPEIPFIFQESWSNNAKNTDIKLRASKCANVDWRAPVLDIKSVYAETRILLAASQFDEAWGRVASEAHVSGIPVIASDNGGLKESVGPGGILISKDAPVSQWVSGLQLMWNNEDVWQKYSEQARIFSERMQINPEYQIQRFHRIISGIPLLHNRYIT